VDDTYEHTQNQINKRGPVRTRAYTQKRKRAKENSEDERWGSHKATH